MLAFIGSQIRKNSVSDCCSEKAMACAKHRIKNTKKSDVRASRSVNFAFGFSEKRQKSIDKQVFKRKKSAISMTDAQTRYKD